MAPHAWLALLFCPLLFGRAHSFFVFVAVVLRQQGVCVCFLFVCFFQAPLRVAGCVSFVSVPYPQGAFCRLARRGWRARSAAGWGRVPRACGTDFDAVMCVGTEKLLGV